jgi:hypothetical protein
VRLPIGQSVRSNERYEHGDVHVICLFDHAGMRKYLVCGATTLPEDAWLSA